MERVIRSQSSLCSCSGRGPEDVPKHLNVPRHTKRLQRRGRRLVLASTSTFFSSLPNRLPALWTPEPITVFGIATVAVLPFYCLMIAFPGSRLAQAGRSFKALLAVAACAYLWLLLAWLPGNIFESIIAAFASCSPLPDMQILAEMLRQPRVTTLAWLHLLMLDFYQARVVFKDGCKSGVATAHSVVLCFMVGPLGLLTHSITKALTKALHRKPHTDQTYLHDQIGISDQAEVA